MPFIEAQDYYKQCDQEVKTDEEKAFSAEELARITEDARRVIDIAKAIPGDSPYLFHEKNCSKMIPTDGYIQNLRKRCE